MKETATKKKRMTALERRQQIMQHAFSLIRERGFKTVSMRDIAREADINEALIYRHFLTKEALLWAIVREMIETQPVRSLFPADGKDEFKAQLQVFVDFYLEKTLGRPIDTQDHPVCGHGKLPPAERVQLSEGRHLPELDVSIH